MQADLRLEQVQVVPIHSELIDELDRIWELRKASDHLIIEQIHAVPCPTCGAKPTEQCELNTGQPRTNPHRDRRLTAEDLLSS
jgi:hypothetical protein